MIETFSYIHCPANGLERSNQYIVPSGVYIGDLKLLIEIVIVEKTQMSSKKSTWIDKLFCQVLRCILTQK